MENYDGWHRKKIHIRKPGNSFLHREPFTQAEMPSINDCKQIAWSVSHKNPKGTVNELV